MRSFSRCSSDCIMSEEHMAPSVSVCPSRISVGGKQLYVTGGHCSTTEGENLMLLLILLLLLFLLSLLLSLLLFHFLPFTRLKTLLILSSQVKSPRRQEVRNYAPPADVGHFRGYTAGDIPGNVPKPSPNRNFLFNP
jgi:hypothetical protein